MRGFRQKKQNIARVFGMRIVTIAAFVGVIVLIQGGWGVYQKEREAHEKRAQAEAQLAALETRQEDLQREIAHLKSDRGVEEELREQFNVAREGEGVIVIVDRKEEEREKKEPEQKWWQGIFPF